MKLVVSVLCVVFLAAVSAQRPPQDDPRAVCERCHKSNILFAEDVLAYNVLVVDGSPEDFCRVEGLVHPPPEEAKGNRDALQHCVKNYKVISAAEEPINPFEFANRRCLAACQPPVEDRPVGDHEPQEEEDQPQEHGDRPPQEHGERPPQEHGERPPQKHGDRPPQEHGERPAQGHGDRPPKKGDRPERPEVDSKRFGNIDLADLVNPDFDPSSEDGEPDIAEDGPMQPPPHPEEQDECVRCHHHNVLFAEDSLVYLALTKEGPSAGDFCDMEATVHPQVLEHEDQFRANCAEKFKGIAMHEDLVDPFQYADRVCADVGACPPAPIPPAGEEPTHDEQPPQPHQDDEQPPQQGHAPVHGDEEKPEHEHQNEEDHGHKKHGNEEEHGQKKGHGNEEEHGHKEQHGHKKKSVSDDGAVPDRANRPKSNI